MSSQGQDDDAAEGARRDKRFQGKKQLFKAGVNAERTLSDAEISVGAIAARPVRSPLFRGGGGIVLSDSDPTDRITVMDSDFYDGTDDEGRMVLVRRLLREGF